MMKTLVISILLLQQIFADLIVTLPDGKIRGFERISPGNRTFLAFQGIPYAKPPLGALRFQPPELPEKWENVLNTTEEKGICYQADLDYPEETEDCLYVNVFTPVLNVQENTTKLPVFFWIYGGGFAHGAARYRSMGPDYLLEKDVVVVNFNYRVGPFGFLSTGDEVIPGNMGLKDQLLALKWTKQNIALFGGDPDKITLLGQSAGGASVGYHILSKQSSGLFRAAIAESGSPLNIWAWLNGTAAKSYALDVARKITNENFEDDSILLKEFLTNAAASDIDRVSQITDIPYPLPVLEIDHEGAFLTEKMYGLLETGDFNQVPLLIGTNNEEEIHKVKDLEALSKSLHWFEDKPSRLIPTNIPIKEEINLTQVGEEILNLYLNKVEPDEKLGYLVRYYSDTQFSRAVIKHAELQSKYTDVYFYVFSYHGIMGNNSDYIKGAERINHGEETRYFVKYSSSSPYSYHNSDLSIFPEKDVITLKRMVQMWTDFAKHMNPTPFQSELLQNITWPKVTPEKYLYLDIDEDLEIKEVPKGKFYIGWKDILEKYGSIPFTTY